MINTCGLLVGALLVSLHLDLGSHVTWNMIGDLLVEWFTWSLGLVEWFTWSLDVTGNMIGDLLVEWFTWSLGLVEWFTWSLGSMVNSQVTFSKTGPNSGCKQ
jgi:hypothetical protein